MSMGYAFWFSMIASIAGLVTFIWNWLTAAEEARQDKVSAAAIVENCLRQVDILQAQIEDKRSIGVDVARSGKDQTVLALRQVRAIGCDYCGRVYSSGVINCEGCGAPRSVTSESVDLVGKDWALDAAAAAQIAPYLTHSQWSRLTQELGL